MKKLPCESVLTTTDLQAIGGLAVESSTLEASIELITWLTLDFSIDSDEFEFGQIITERYQFDGKLAILRDLVKIRIKRDEAKWLQFKLVFDNISDLIAKRNTVIHGEWSRQLKLPPGSPAVAARYKRNQQNIPKITSDKVMELAHLFAKAHNELWGLYHNYRSELSPSPKIPF